MPVIDKNEYPRWYDSYMELVPEGYIFDLLDENMKTILELYKSFSEEKSLYRYAEGKWSIKEILGHIIDTERIFAYRILRFSRADKTDIPQYDHNMYVERAEFDKVPLKNLIREYRTLKVANRLLFESLNEDQLLYTGTADGKEFTVRAIMYILVGHELHHLGVLKDRYIYK